MKFIISDHSTSKVYHLAGCPHAARIKYQNRMEISRERANVLGYRRCKCCGNLKDTIRVLTTNIEFLGTGREMDVTYQPKTDTVYIRTKIGFWKTFWKDDAGLLLYHLNRYDSSKSAEELSHAAFHRQQDVKATESLEKILSYIEKHDQAKEIIADDYRKLPQKTAKQRKYYRQAESRNRRSQVNRIFAIFSEIEKGNNLAQYSFC